MSATDFDTDKLNEQMGEILDSFEAHPLMQPPNTHPTLFFLFDFIRNTRKELQAIDAERLHAGDAQARSRFVEVRGRNMFANGLINDASGRVALLTGSDPRRPVDFGQDIKDKMRVLAA